MICSSKHSRRPLTSRALPDGSSNALILGKRFHRLVALALAPPLPDKERKTSPQDRPDPPPTDRERGTSPRDGYGRNRERVVPSQRIGTSLDREGWDASPPRAGPLPPSLILPHELRLAVECCRNVTWALVGFEREGRDGAGQGEEQDRAVRRFVRLCTSVSGWEGARIGRGGRVAVGAGRGGGLECGDAESADPGREDGRMGLEGGEVGEVGEGGSALQALTEATLMVDLLVARGSCSVATFNALLDCAAKTVCLFFRPGVWGGEGRRRWWSSDDTGQRGERFIFRKPECSTRAAKHVLHSGWA
jgi:hypothetical protein